MKFFVYKVRSRILFRNSKYIIYKMQFNNILENFGKTFLDWIFPIARDRRFLDTLTAEKFLALVGSQPRFFKQQNKYGTFSIVSYKNQLVRQSVWSLKFKNNRGIANLFAEIIYDTLAEELAEIKLSANFDNPILTPVPLSRQRLRERGYNQTALIARGLANLDQNNFFEYQEQILKKIKDTPPQSRSKNKTERQKNLKGCFKIANPVVVKNKNIILLDDVITTGATLDEASKILRRAGARKIFRVTFAY